jgi:hypothetical protein
MGNGITDPHGGKKQTSLATLLYLCLFGNPAFHLPGVKVEKGFL